MTYKPFFNVKLYRKIIQFPCFKAFPEVENNEMVKSEYSCKKCLFVVAVRFALP